MPYKCIVCFFEKLYIIVQCIVSLYIYAVIYAVLVHVIYSPI